VQPIRVLIVDDDEDDFVLARGLLDQAAPSYVVEWASSYEEGLARLEAESFDACLVDYRLGARDGVALIAEAGARGLLVPSILLTGDGSLEVDLAGMAAGAADFLHKGQLTASLLERAIRYSVQQRRVEEQRLEILLEQRARREAEAEGRAKDRFLAMLGHELRNPLGAIANAADLLREPDLPAETRDLASGILARQIGVMRRLVDDLLDASRLSHGKLVLQRERVDLADVVRRAAANARPQIEARGQTLAVSLPEAPAPVDGDPTRLEQMVANLLHNAEKYGAPAGRIELSLANEGGERVLRVRDEGAGMTEEMLAAAFDLFVQDERTAARAGGGLGLGLTLVKQIVELHGGTVRAESQGPERGSTFTIRLPAASGEVREAAPAPPRPAAAPQRPLSVLIVDDNADARESLARLVALRGHRTVCADDGVGALRAFERERPDAVLLDIGLPGEDGFAVARRLRAAQGGRPLALAAMTGFGRRDDRALAQRSGFDRYFVKPLDLDALDAFLDEVAGGAAPS
jgi:signal transduction histidine kinase